VQSRPEAWQTTTVGGTSESSPIDCSERGSGDAGNRRPASSVGLLDIWTTAIGWARVR
jgi:hypothetical protein